MRAHTPLRPEVFAKDARELTERQRAFVDAYLANGGRSGKAALSAGYAARSADTAASRLVANPLIQHAILKATLTAIGLSAVPALATVRRLSEKARSEYVRLEAARDLLDRAGFRPPERVDHRLDAGLTVTLNLQPRRAAEGGSETGSDSDVTRPDTGKTAPKLIDVDFSTPQDVVFPKTDLDPAAEGAGEAAGDGDREVMERELSENPPSGGSGG